MNRSKAHAKKTHNTPPNSPEHRQAFQEFIEGLMRKHSVNVLESLEKEARTLRYLTIVFCQKTEGVFSD